MARPNSQQIAASIRVGGFCPPSDHYDLLGPLAFKGTVSQVFCPHDFPLTNPSGPLTDMLKHFRICLQIRGDIHNGSKRFLFRGVIDTIKPYITNFKNLIFKVQIYIVPKYTFFYLAILFKATRGHDKKMFRLRSVR